MAARGALTAADARAATVGDRVLLAHPPRSGSGDLGVVAHELSHVAERATRPRFLLRSASGVLDAGERRARDLGSKVAAGGEDAVRSAGDLASGVGDRLEALPAARLPSGADAVEKLRTAGGPAAATSGSLAEAVDARARRAITTAERGARQAERPLAEAVAAGRGATEQARDRARSSIAEGRQGLDDVTTRAADAATHHRRRASAVAGGLGSAGRGLVGDARRSATEAATSARRRAGGAFDEARGRAEGALATGREHVGRVGAQLDDPAGLDPAGFVREGADRARTHAAALPVRPGAVVSRASGELQDHARSAHAGVARHADTASELARGVTDTGGAIASSAGAMATRVARDAGAAGTAAGSAATRMAGDATTTIRSTAAAEQATQRADAVVDGLVEQLEERLLAELERRGGRYGGLF